MTDRPPRDTPHLDRDGDRWRGRPSGLQPAVTDDGPRSESRSSGGWQGGPSGDDIDRAIAIVTDSRQTHVNWAAWRRKGNGTDNDHEMIGDLEWHENAIRDYDHVLKVLRSYRDAAGREGLTVPARPPASGEPTGLDPGDGSSWDRWDIETDERLAASGEPSTALRISERHVAENILNRRYADPDDDCAVIARAALRLAEARATPPALGELTDAIRNLQRQWSGWPLASPEDIAEALLARLSASGESPEPSGGPS